ncbi:MAG: sigma-70 family RNA polymerase sigma factor [Planctomycetia bacterium]|nr:sigma-70 family RNA polymerase sigma factor [Planctomycetia bacterium]
MTPFLELFEKVRQGDPEAAEQIVRAYEPEIRRTIRVRMTDSHLRRIVDSCDLCQSVMAAFFVRAAAGQFDVESPRDLLNLLVTMARNRVTDWVRHDRASRRDGRRDVSLEANDLSAREFVEQNSGPPSIVADRELLQRVRCRLSHDEQRLMEWRAEGRQWTEIGAELKEHPAAVRMRFTRALDRITTEMGLEG